MPLKEIKPINDRLGVVKIPDSAGELRKAATAIRHISDLERTDLKNGLQKANPREVCQLKKALIAIGESKNMRGFRKFTIKAIGEQLNPCTLISDKIKKNLNLNPVMIVKGSVMNEE